MISEFRELLGVDPNELRFAFELKKQISCSLHLTNKTEEYVAFKVKTTSPKKYCVRPNNGIVAPRSTFDVLVTMQAQREAPPDMHCKDKFLVQSAIVSRDITPKDISGDMFTKESGNVVDEVRLKVVYAPQLHPAPINEGFDQESLGSLSYQETTRELVEPETITSEVSYHTTKLITREHVEPETITSEVSSHPTKLITRELAEPETLTSEPLALISKLKEEKNSTVQQNNKLREELREELDLLRREISRLSGCLSLVFVLVVAILGILVGYLMNRRACVTM